ncbi:MAG: DUF4124 domain-containing protein [Gammaproteobacteria bacterium]
MYKSKCISLALITLLLLSVVLPVHADIVHKWVDAKGVTHYSDQLPKDTDNSAKQITLSNAYSRSDRANYRENYYSVTNQWARMREERIERKQLYLDKKKQKAAQQVIPQVVYVNQAEERPQSVYYPAYLGRHVYKHRNYNTGKKHHNYYSNRYSNSNNASSCRLPRNYYSGKAYSENAGASLSFTFR